MAVLNDRKNDYKHYSEQECKDDSLNTSKSLVRIVQGIFQNILYECEEYEPESKLRINGAPAVKLPNGKLVIAPDLKCKTKNGDTFWIEVKDKCQRFFKPDTGADLHQILGFYQIHKELQEPVLMIFKDASFEECSKSGKDFQKARDLFKPRWEKFSGEFYGNWLNKCIKIWDSKKYPLIAFERSRKDPMYIYYFCIESLEVIDTDNIINNINNEKNIQQLVAYRKNIKNQFELHDINDLIELSIENLKLVTTNKEYKDTPIVDIKEEHLNWFIEHSNYKYHQIAKKEKLRRSKK